MIDYIKYESLIEDKLIKLKQIGLNTKVFDKKYEKLKKLKYKNFNKILNNKENKYTFKLLKFYYELSKYDIYINAFRTCNLISKALDNITGVNISYYINIIMKLLPIVNKEDFEKPIELLNKLYEVTYKLIKLEYSLNSTSYLYDFCKNNINVKHFNNLVLSDIEKIDSKEINDLKEYCDQNSINYLDSDIIKIIIRNNKSLEMLPNK